MDNTTPPILTLEEAAALLRVTPEWLRKSRCPRCKVGGVVRYDRDACLGWMRGHLTPAAA
jgi:hypothetical protein